MYNCQSDKGENKYAIYHKYVELNWIVNDFGAKYKDNIRVYIHH